MIGPIQGTFVGIYYLFFSGTADKELMSLIGIFKPLDLSLPFYLIIIIIIFH